MDKHWIVLFPLEEQLHSTDSQVKTGSWGRFIGSDEGKVETQKPDRFLVLKLKAEGPSSH